MRRGDGPPVYFGYRTALEIARSANLAALPRTRGASNRPPDASPSAGDVSHALEVLSSACRGPSVTLPAHILVGGASRCRRTETLQPHMSSLQASPNSFCRIADGVFFCIPPLSRLHEATRAKTEASRMELAFELCGTYQTPRTAARSAYEVAPLAFVRELRDYASRNSALNGSRKLLSAVRFVAGGSASPRETKLALVLGLPHSRGGGNLGIPRMNYEVRASREALAITSKSHFRCDLCWPEAKLDVEYQSRECHEGEASRIGDSRRVNALVSMGWTVIGVTNDELDSLAATDTIVESLGRLLGKRPRCNIADYHARKLKLRRQLGLPVGFDR